jgi:hypothetical protein
MPQELGKKVFRTPILTTKWGYKIAFRKIWTIICIPQWGALGAFSNTSHIQMEKVPLRLKMTSFWWLLSEILSETRTFLRGKNENYFSGKESLSNPYSKMMIKMRSRKYSASWQTNTTRSIQSRSRSMLTTTQRVHYCLLMHRQEDSISAAPIKSKITSRWEALTEKRVHIQSLRNCVATLTTFSCTCPIRRLQ